MDDNIDLDDLSDLDDLDDRKKAIKLILITYMQFSIPLKELYSYMPRFNEDISQEMKEIIKIYDSFKDSLDYQNSESLGDDNEIRNRIIKYLLPELNNASDKELEDLFNKCRKLARSYDLPIKDSMNIMIELTDPMVKELEQLTPVEDADGNIIGGFRLMEYSLITGGVKIHLEFFITEKLDVTSFNWFQTYSVAPTLNLHI